MAGRVLIARVESRDKPVSEREVRGPQLFVRLTQVGREPTLLLVHQEPSLGGEGRPEEKRQRPGRNIPVGHHEEGDGRAIERDRCDYDGHEFTKRLAE